jgi:uncharacterized membrane protein YqjE
MLLKSLKGLGMTFIEIIRTRIEILSLDVMEARVRFVSILMLGAFTFLLLSLGIILGMFWLIITFWESYRFMVMGILTVTLIGCGLVLLVILVWKLKKGPKLFEGTIAELDRDREALRDRGRRCD